MNSSHPSKNKGGPAPQLHSLRGFLATAALGSLAMLTLLSAKETAEPESKGGTQFAQRVFAKGVNEIRENVTIDGPVTLENGVVFNIKEGATLTFKGELFAPPVHLFKGNGRVAGLKKLLPEWFGAIGDGKANDTVALQKAIDSCRHRGFAAGAGNVVLLTKSYLVDSLIIKSSYVNLHAENAWLIANPKAKCPYLLKYDVYAQFGTITGTLSIDGGYNLGYDCILNVNTRHFIGNNVVIWRASLPWLFGDRKWAASGIPGDAEKGDSEIEIIGGSTSHCLRGVEAVGANTIVVFSNALIYSYPWTLRADDPRKEAWEKADSTLVRSVGSMVYFTGGGLANFTAKVPLVEVQPIRCTQDQYYSEYGGVYISNAHIEAGNLFAAVNPQSISTQDSKGNKVVQRSSSFTMLSCGGYMCGDVTPINTDSMFTGRIIVKNCNFYSVNKSAKVAKIGNPRTIVEIDDMSFNHNHQRGLNAVEGGTQLFSNRMIFEARRSSQPIEPAGTIVACTTPVATSDSANFQRCYNAATGEFTTPFGGLRAVCVTARAQCFGATAADLTKMEILKNGVSVVANHSVAGSAWVSYTFDALSEGDIIGIRLSTSAETKVLSGDDLNSLQIVASRY